MELSLISQYRTALMGIATIMILVCHSAGPISMPSIIGYPISYLNIGVDIFLFLSGMGMYYSLKKRMTRLLSGADIQAWSKRFKYRLREYWGG